MNTREMTREIRDLADTAIGALDQAADNWAFTSAGMDELKDVLAEIRAQGDAGAILDLDAVLTDLQRAWADAIDTTPRVVRAGFLGQVEAVIDELIDMGGMP